MVTGLDSIFEELLGRAARTMEGECIRSLLSGNDTQCFTTEQFEAAKERWLTQHIGRTREELGVYTPPRSVARKQLLAIGLVVEVKPDVWTFAQPAGEQP